MKTLKTRLKIIYVVHTYYQWRQTKFWIIWPIATKFTTYKTYPIQGRTLKSWKFIPHQKCLIYFSIYGSICVLKRLK
jgi:hypothetical protein